MDMNNNSVISEEKQKLYEQRPQLYKPGQSGNPNGRPKGSLSLKSKIENYLLDNPKKLEKVIITLATNPKFHALMWQMLEGMPSQKVSGDPNKPILVQISQEVAQRNKIKQAEVIEGELVTNNIINATNTDTKGNS